MATWLLIPVKRLERAKSRLAPAMPPAARIRLAWRLVGRTFRVVRQVPEVRPLVISADRRVLALARRMGWPVVLDRWEDLNRALAEARRVAVRHGAEALGVLPIDLPGLRAEALRDLLAAGFPDRGLVLVPDRHGQGTNALLVRPPEAIAFCFGPGSLAAFQRQAAALGLPVRLFPHPDLSWDLDTPADWAAWRARAAADVPR